MSEPFMSVSNSEIQLYKSCKRAWYLAHYLQLAPRTTSVVGPLALGTRLHAALEAYYTDQQDLLQAHSELLDVDRQLLLSDERDITELESEGELGRIMLEGYLEWLEETGADSDWEVIAAEQVVAVPLTLGTGDVVELKGKLDMQVRRLSDGARLFVDNKTAASFSDLTRTSYINEQFLNYHLLELLTLPEDERSDGGVYNMLRKVKRGPSAKPPFYDRLEVRHNQEMLRSFWTRVHGVITDMVRVRKQLDAGADHKFVAYPTPSRDCVWKCGFFAVCPLMDDGSAASRMLEELYVKHDPYERYLDPVTAV